MDDTARGIATASLTLQAAVLRALVANGVRSPEGGSGRLCRPTCLGDRLKTQEGPRQVSTRI
jgi:hypothetical protein